MRSPIFSIIIATYNRADLLPRALESILKQTFADFECIVVDDGSDQDLSELIRRQNDERLVLIRHQRNKGVAAAYNSGIKASRGAFISLLDDDDEYNPMFLEKMHLFFRSAPSHIGFAWTGIRKVLDTPNGEVLLHEKIWPGEFHTKEIAYTAVTTIGNGFGLTVKRKCLDEVGLFNESFRMCEDTEHLFRLARKFDFAVIPEILVKLHQHDNDRLTNSGNDDIRLPLYERVLTENADLLLKFPELYYVHYRRVAEICYSLNMRRKGRRILFNIWKKLPFRISIPMDLFCFTAFGADFRATVRKYKIQKLLPGHSVLSTIKKPLSHRR